LISGWSTGEAATRRRRLGDHQDHLHARVLVEGLDREPRHAPVDRLGQVATADPDHIGDARSPAGDQAHDLLRAGAGRRHHPDRAGRHDVGEPEPGPSEHRRAGARTHHQQAERCGALLELDLGGHVDVVAEQQDVQSG
jgi:hypothetical protein